MEERQKTVIEDQILHGYNFTIGEYLREGWDIYKRFAGGFIGFMLLTILINFVAGLIPIIGFIVTTFIIGPALVAGNYIVADKIAKGDVFRFNDFFRGFDYIGPLALMTLIMYVIIGLVMVPTIMAFGNSGLIEWYMEIIQNPFGDVAEPPIPGAKTWGIMALNMIPLFYLMVAYVWAPLFVVFFKANAWEALETSRRLITRRWFPVFGLMLTLAGIVLLAYLPAVLILIASPVLGSILLFFIILAIVLAIPAVYGIFYAAFADVTRLYEEASDDIVDHLVE